MSPRAAWRLESLGFVQVYDHVAGKVDWLASGLPIEGELANIARAGHVARHDAPTCQLADRVGDVRERVRASGWDCCVVVNDRHILLGLLDEKALGAEPQQPAEDVMEPGPTTFRPDVTVDEMVTYMREHDLQAAFITTQTGDWRVCCGGATASALREGHARR